MKQIREGYKQTKVGIIPRYVDTFKDELVEIKSKMNEYLKELGL